MENLSPEGNTASTGSNNERSSKKTTAEKKPTLSSPISQKQSEVAGKLAQPSILERLTGERTKPEPKLETKPELTAPAVPPEVAEHAQPAATEQAESASAKPETKEADDAPFVEIPLGEVRDEAAEYIDLHQQVLAEAGPSAENKADSALLEQAADDIQAAEPETSFKEVIDDAYSQTVNDLHQNPENFTPDEVETSRETPTYLPPPPQVAEQAYRQAEAEAIPAATPARSERVAPVAPEDTRTAVPWYYRYGDGRRFYPAPWPPRSPEKSLVDKISDKVRNRRERRTTERVVEQKLDRQTEAVQRYIDMKEQAIRQEAAAQIAEQVSVPPKTAEPLSPAWQPNVTPRSEPLPPLAAAPRPPFERAAPVPSPELMPAPAGYQEQRSPQTAERVQRLDRRELLNTAEKIIIDGTSVRTMYESKRISEEGMRRVVTEYYRGGDIKHTLDQELMIKELTYERDPQIRDLLRSRIGLQADATTASPASSSNTASTSTSPLTPDAGESSQSVPPETQPSKRAANPAEQALLRTWAAVVVVLAFIAVVLILR